MKSRVSSQETDAYSGTSYEMLPMQKPCSSTPHSSRAPSTPRKPATKRWKPSKFPWRVFAVISSLPLALLPIVLLSALAEIASQSYLAGRDCYPNGLWKEASGATWRIMDSSYFFTPNLSFGAMSFTEVKVIDVAWDLVVGRGGQMLLAWVNYVVFNEWLLYHMELHRTSYKMATSVAFQTTTLHTLGVLGKEWLAFGERSWSRFWRWLAMLCMLIATFYVLAFPTLMAAMTGYITTYEPYVMDEGRNLVPWKEVRRIEYIVHNSSRVGDYRDNLVSVAGDDELAKAVANYSRYYLNVFPGRPNFESTVLPPGFIGTNAVQRNVSSIFIFNGTTTHLNPPTLKVTFGLPRGPPSAPSPGLSYPYYSLTPGATTARQGPYFPASYIHAYGSCKPSETYQWGFSYIFLFMVSIFNFVWSCIMVGMWMDTRTHSRMYRTGRRPGLLRSILDIAAVMREEVAEEGGEGDVLGEKEIRRKLSEGASALVVPKGEARIARVGASGEMKERGWKRRLTKGSTF
ncbi:hypothetical protein P171DRAFT_459867 [Karstenula rhodostoma CBS 690.94]|uniref:Uncharacterized protein n=1 Tax=Karstenula rhodostoma CBS 690.94 TaxID=1392251 RepID=A0A9P4UJD8_9PLEO|nr:hypothetical protein P171DRAFT_459867 [Karstenula rhodostoma CBS 690.94]